MMTGHGNTKFSRIV